MGAILPVLGAIIAKLGWALLTEHVVKHVLVATAEIASKKTTNDVDDKLVKTIKQAWGIE